MITEKDIKKRIAEILKENGYAVYASDTAEGFKKPSCCVYAFPSSVSRENGSTVLVTMTCNILYFPETETTEKLINTAVKMREMFFDKPFDVSDRHITVNEINFGTDSPNLSVDFELSFYDTLNSDGTETDVMDEVNFNINY